MSRFSFKLSASLARSLGVRRRNGTLVVVDAGHAVQCSGTYWDSGSRADWFHVSRQLATRDIACPLNPPQFGGGDAPEVAVSDAVAVMRAGTSCGKAAFPVIYCTAEWLAASQLADAPREPSRY